METKGSIHSLISHAVGFLSRWNDPASMSPKLHFPTRRHFYYALVRTLNQGSGATATHSARPPLPFELIIQILRDAECTTLSRLSLHVGEPMYEADEVPLGDVAPQIFPAPDLATMGWPLPLINHEEIGKKVFWERTEAHSRGGNRAWRDWFSSRPLSKRDLASIHSMQLLTRSKGIGWRVHPCGGGGWFDVFLIPEKAGAGNHKKHLWRIKNDVRPNDSNQGRTGAAFGIDHEIWRLAQVGDRIGARVWLRDSGWRDIATSALLIVEEYFVPHMYMYHIDCVTGRVPSDLPVAGC